MSKKSMNEILFDAALEKAFADAWEQEMKELEREELPAAEINPRHRRKERRAFARTQRRTSRLYEVSRKIAACLLIVLGLNFTAILVIPTVRAAVWDSVVEFFEKYMVFDFVHSDSDSVVIGDYTMEYVPDGFALLDAYEMRLYSLYKFSNLEGDWFNITYFSSEEQANLKYDKENCDVRKVMINGTEAYTINHYDGTYTLIWEINDIPFSLDSNIKYSEMKKIAEKIGNTVVTLPK